MEFAPTEDTMDLGYPTVPAGRYLWKIEEVKMIVNEETGSKGYGFDLVVDAPIEGDPAAEGLKSSWYINVINKAGEVNPFGEKQINGIVSMTGNVEAFAKKFSSGVDIDDDRLAAALGIKLPDKFLDMTHVIEKYTGKDGAERERANFIKFQAYKSGASSGGAKKPAAKKPAAEAASDGDDW